MKYILKKAVFCIITILAVSFLVFLAFSVIPGDPALAKLGTDATPERVEAMREEMGLNEALPVRYIKWIGGFIKGDMGTSYSYQLPVSKMLLDKIPITLTVTFLAFFMIIVTALPLGIYAAKHEGSVIDRIISITGQVTMSVPPFFLGILLTFLFGLVFRWFTPGGYVSYEQNVGQFIRYLFFPAVAIALPKSAMTMKLLRTSVSKEAKQDYARTAYSKGNRTNSVLFYHVLKNAMIPVVTFLGMAFTDMIAGSIIVEQVFSIPGIGRILLTSISNRDYPVVQAIIVLIAVVVLLVNFFVDMIYKVMDPRITIE